MSDLDAMLKRAAQHKMTPAEQHAQRRSWVIGQMMCSRPDMTREEAERLADGAVGPNLAARVAELEAEIGRLQPRPIGSAPATGDFLAFNRMTGWYVTRREGGHFPMHGWDGMLGAWYPEPSFWMPLPPAPCDEPRRGGDATAAPGRSPAGAVPEGQAPSLDHSRPTAPATEQEEG